MVIYSFIIRQFAVCSCRGSYWHRQEPQLRRSLLQMQDQTRKIALIIGGSRGIGRAIALRLAQSGFAIWLTYKGNHDAAGSAKSEIEAAGGVCELIPFDVSSFEETEAALGARMETVAPDVLVYNSGIAR